MGTLAKIAVGVLAAIGALAIAGAAAMAVMHFSMMATWSY